MEWFRLAAQQGHPKSSYNLAIGHLSGMKTNLEVYISNSVITNFGYNGPIKNELKNKFNNEKFNLIPWLLIRIFISF